MPSSCVWDSTRRTMKKILMGVATLATLALSLTACGADPNAADAPEAVADGDSSEILIGGSLNLDGEQSAYDALILEGIEVAVAETKDRKSTRLNSSHVAISYAVFC